MTPTTPSTVRRRGDRTRARSASPSRLGSALALSCLVHATAAVAWLASQAGAPRTAPSAVMVALAESVPEDRERLAPRDPGGSPAPPVGPGEGAGDASVGPAVTTPPGGPRAEAGLAVAALEHAAAVQQAEHARRALEGEVEALTSDKAELATRLSTAEERVARLERDLARARAAEQERLARTRAAYDALVAELQHELADKTIALHRVQGQLTVTIVDRVLFPSGQASLTSEGQRVLRRVGEALARVDERPVLIEGHTDDVPIGPTLRDRFPSNWELSTARASEVVRFLAGPGGLPPGRLRAAGRADTEPVASNATEDGRRLNRRIEIILLPDAAAAGPPSS